LGESNAQGCAKPLLENYVQGDESILGGARTGLRARGDMGVPGVVEWIGCGLLWFRACSGSGCYQLGEPCKRADHGWQS